MTRCPACGNTKMISYNKETDSYFYCCQFTFELHIEKMKRYDSIVVKNENTRGDSV